MKARDMLLNEGSFSGCYPFTISSVGCGTGSGDACDGALSAACSDSDPAGDSRISYFWHDSDGDKYECCGDDDNEHFAPLCLGVSGERRCCRDSDRFIDYGGNCVKADGQACDPLEQSPQCCGICDDTGFCVECAEANCELYDDYECGKCSATCDWFGEDGGHCCAVGEYYKAEQNKCVPFVACLPEWTTTDHEVSEFFDYENSDWWACCPVSGKLTYTTVDIYSD